MFNWCCALYPNSFGWVRWQHPWLRGHLVLRPIEKATLQPVTATAYTWHILTLDQCAIYGTSNFINPSSWLLRVTRVHQPASLRKYPENHWKPSSWVWASKPCKARRFWDLRGLSSCESPFGHWRSHGLLHVSPASQPRQSSTWQGQCPHRPKAF